MLKPTSRPNAIHLFAITILMLSTWFPPDQNNRLVEAGLIRIYHKLKTPSQVNQTDSLTPAASGSMKQPDEEEDTSRTSIEISSSPMRKIMDLIGQHAPVIVLDSSSEDPTPPSPPQPLTSTLMSPVASGRPASPGEQGQASVMMGDSSMAQQQQLQHWAILDPGQLQQQQQQQQQQPLAQPQQLFQSTVPNEQYFTFTPFGLAPTSNPFAAQVSQDQSPILAYPDQFHGQQFNGFTSQPQQSSQNQQQMAQQQQQAQNEIQPVFLSSYVPELPSPAGGQQQVGPFAANQNPSAQPQNRFQQQPNSIQQIQQAQAQQGMAPVRDRGGGGGGESETEAPAARKKDDSESDAPASQSAAEPEGDDADKSPAGPDDGEPGERSISYEDKYDSDKDEAEPEPERSSSVRKSSSNNQQVAATPPARRTSRDNDAGGRGFESVGLNDDCLQCICRASTGCDEMARCITIGAEEKYCGPFWLTEEYWQRAGSPASEPNSMSPFEDCANDLDCAAQTVTKYMWRYKRDCDGDKLMTCIDYARLHKLKPDECAQSELMDSKDYQEYWGKFMNCADGYNRTRNADDESFRGA